MLQPLLNTLALRAVYKVIRVVGDLSPFFSPRRLNELIRDPSLRLFVRSTGGFWLGFDLIFGSFQRYRTVEQRS